MSKNQVYLFAQKNQEASKFKNYCADNYAIDLLGHFLNSEQFNQLSESQQLNILRTYKEKLIFKNKIDKEVLLRTRLNITNQELLKSLKFMFLKYPKNKTQQDRDELDQALSLHSDSKTTVMDNIIKDLTTSINAHRSDTLWFRELLLSFVDQRNTQSESFKEFLKMSAYLSFSLYGIRGGWEITKLINHTFIKNNPFYEENKLGTLDRLSVQLQIRYPIIVNDVVWGLTNSLCYFLLKNNDPTAGWLTFIMSFVDLLNLCKQTYDIQQNFQKLKDELGTIPKEMQDQHNRAMASQFLSILIQLGMIASFIAVFTLLPGVAPVAGIIACFVMQVFNNIKEHLIQIYNSNDKSERWSIALKMVLRLMLQVIIPALFILCSLYLIPIIQAGAAFWIINISLIFMSKLLVDFVSQLSDNFKNIMTSDEKINALMAEKTKLDIEKTEIESILKTHDHKIKSILATQRHLNNQLMSVFETPDFFNLCQTIQIQQNELAGERSELKNQSSVYLNRKKDIQQLIEKNSLDLKDIRLKKAEGLSSIKDNLSKFLLGASTVSFIALSSIAIATASAGLLATPFLAIPLGLMLISAISLGYSKFHKPLQCPSSDQVPALPSPNRT